MSGRKKSLWIIFCIFCGFFILFCSYPIVSIFIVSGVSIQSVDKEKAEQVFVKDYQLLLNAREYLENSMYNEVYINSDMEEENMFADGQDKTIKNEDIINTFNQLKKIGYIVFGKQGQTIYFQRWSNLDNGRGIACSINGEKPQFQFLTKLERFSEKNWYYYEKNFNEWKLKNK